MKKTISVLLCAIVFLCALVPIGSAYTAKEAWEAYYEENADVGRTMLMQPGADETQRNFSWIAPKNAKDCFVSVSTNANMSGAVRYKANLFKTENAEEVSAQTTVTGLKLNTTYYYTCTSDKDVSAVYSFTTGAPGSMTAMYVSDVHITGSSAVEHGRVWSNVVDQAIANAGQLDVVLSAGDQTSNGSESEYRALVASPALKTVPLATTIGNHDYGYDFYYEFTNVPNAKDGYDSWADDYWFVKGDVLFMVMDSNDRDIGCHERFMRVAIGKNPTAKWRVVMMHHDLFSGVMSDREKEAAELRPLWIPLFDRFDVDLVLLGHTHYFSVSHVLYDGEIEKEVKPNGTVSDVNGTVYMVTNSINRTRKDSDPSYSDKIAVGYDPGQVIYNLITCTRDQLVIRSYDYEEDAVFNTLTIKKNAGVRRGDVNADGFFTAADARLALRTAVGMNQYSTADYRFISADYNHDGSVTAADARSILRLAVNLHP